MREVAMVRACSGKVENVATRQIVLINPVLIVQDVNMFLFIDGWYTNYILLLFKGY